MGEYTETLTLSIDGEWYDALIREHIGEGEFDQALELVRAMTDGIEGITDAEREQLEMDIMNGSRHFTSEEGGLIGITELA